jgi:hypothetical protein
VATSGHPDAPNGHRKTARSSSSGKSLPHNVDAEASILGGLILKNELLALLATLEIRRLLPLPASGRLRGDPEPRSREAADRRHDPRGRDREARQARRDRRPARSSRRARAEGPDRRQRPGLHEDRPRSRDASATGAEVRRDHRAGLRLGVRGRTSSWATRSPGLETIRREYQEAGDDVPLISIGGALEQLHHLASKPSIRRRSRR